MNIDSRLYVEIVPLEDGHAPSPHPIRDGQFDPALVYKVLGMYNPSETSECYFVLANPDRQIWFIPQRHLRAYRLIDSDEFFLPRHAAAEHSLSDLGGRRLNGNGNGHHNATGTIQLSSRAPAIIAT